MDLKSIIYERNFKESESKSSDADRFQEAIQLISANVLIRQLDFLDQMDLQLKESLDRYLRWTYMCNHRQQVARWLYGRSKFNSIGTNLIIYLCVVGG